MMGLLLILVTVVSGQKTPESDRIKTIGSLKKLDDFPLYMMSFYGDYELPEYTAKGTLPQDMQIGNQPGNPNFWACTCFSAQGENGNQLLARNFDWEDHPALLLFTDPPGRYASVSMVDISYLGYSKSENPGKNRQWSPPGHFPSIVLLPCHHNAVRQFPTVLDNRRYRQKFSSQTALRPCSGDRFLKSR